MITPSIWRSSYQVNTTITGPQQFGQVAAAPDGSYYSVWNDGSVKFSPKVTGRKFDASGNPVTAEKQIASPMSSDPSLAVTPDGGLHVVVYTGGTNVFNFAPDLTPGTSYALADTSDTQTAFYPAITSFADGGLFAAYNFRQTQLTGQLISPAGVVGDRAGLQVNDASHQIDHVRLATLDNQNLVVVFEYPTTASDHDIYFQIRNEDSSLVTGSTLVVTDTTS
jgi:hypothetical protein